MVDCQLDQFLKLRSINIRGTFASRMLQFLLGASILVRSYELIFRTSQTSLEKDLLAVACRVGVLLFHLMYMKMNAGPVELEPLMLAECVSFPVPPLTHSKGYTLDPALLKVERESFNKQYATHLAEGDYRVLQDVWKDRYNSYAKTIWHSGVPDWQWFNNKSRWVMQLVTPLLPIIYSVNLLSSPGTVVLKELIIGLLESCCYAGIILFLVQMTLELSLVLHMEATQLRRHLARILVGELKSLEEIFEDHLRIKTCTLASWTHYQLAMLYAAFLSFVTLSIGIFYIYTEGEISKGFTFSGYVSSVGFVVLLWGYVLADAAGFNLISDLFVFQIPLMSNLSFNDRQELVRYYQLNKAYFYLLPMGLVVTPIIALGWLLSFASMGVVALMNSIVALAETRVAMSSAAAAAAAGVN